MRKPSRSKLRQFEARHTPIADLIAATRTDVYVVEHDSAVRDSLDILLGSCGYAALCFSRAAEFLAKLSGTERGPLIIGFQLSDSNACDVLARMTLLGVSLPTIVTHRSYDQALEKRVLEAGAQIFLAKPWTAEEFICAFELARQRMRLLSH
jgi:FixJ family two-component response regulator